MREDIEYISGVLDELEAIVQDASRVPMRRGRAVVDRADLLVMLDELRGSLPAELPEAEAIRRECAAVIAAAEEEARRIIEDAQERAEVRVVDTELYRRSQRRAAETIDRAERYAREIEGGSEVYRDRVMGQLENWFEDSLISVGESRQELTSSSPALTNSKRPVEPAAGPVEEQEPEENNENGQGWRASSA